MDEPNAESGQLSLDAALAEQAGAAAQMHDTVVVESGLHRSRRASVAHVVLFRAAGLDAATLAEVTRDLQFRLGVIPGLDDATLEISSPGIQRTLKHEREYQIFVGKGVRVLTVATENWHEGIISAVTDGNLVLAPLANTQGAPLLVPLVQIRTARLTGSEWQGREE